jgi:hypothetical protein
MRRLTLLVSLVALVGCGDSTPQEAVLGPTETNVVGTFALRTSNGKLLPLIIRLTVDEEWDLTSDALVIGADNTWTETTNYRITTFATGAITTQSTASSGTYSIGNSQIKFVMTTGGTGNFTGSVSGNTLSLLYNGGHFVYSR